MTTTYPYVMRVLAMADGSPAAGYVARSQPSAILTHLDVKLTGDPAQAMHFASFADAHVYFSQVCPLAPVRVDGRPNRPLTAFTVTFEPAP